MKRFILIVVVLIGLGVQCVAQLSAMNYKSEGFAAFKASKTYAVKSGNAAYDAELESAMKDIWKITSFDMIDVESFKTKITDPSASFIVSATIEVNGPNQAYHYIALINGGKKSIKKYGYTDMVAYAPLNHWVDENESSDCAFRIRNILQSMVTAIELVQKNDSWGNTKDVVDHLRKIYQAKAPQIKDRILLVNAKSVGGKKMTKEVFGGIYPYKFEFCDREKIAKAIREKSTEYYYLQPGITLNKSIFVFDPSNGEVVYFDYSMMGMSVTDDNIEDLVKTIKQTGKK